MSDTKTVSSTSWNNSPPRLQQTQAQQDGGTGSPSTRAQLSGFLSGVSIAGVKYASDPSGFWGRRLVWFCLVLLGASLMTFQILGRISYFLSRPTDVDVEFTYDSQMRFPTVTICNENMVLKRVADEYGKGIVG